MVTGDNRAALASGAAGPYVTRPNWLEVDLGAIAHNVAQVRQLAGPGTRLLAALKANGYRIGLVPVGLTRQVAGVDTLAVVDPRDAVRLRESGAPRPILLYAGALVEPASVRPVEEYDLMVTVGDAASARVFSAAATRPIPAFAEVDVGRLVYGVTRPELKPTTLALSLRPAFIGLKSRLTFCKRVERPDYRELSPFPIRADMRIGVAPMGFADGLGILRAGAPSAAGSRSATRMEVGRASPRPSPSRR